MKKNRNGGGNKPVEQKKPDAPKPDKPEVNEDAGTTVVKPKEEPKGDVPNADILRLMHSVHKKVAQGK